MPPDNVLVSYKEHYIFYHKAVDFIPFTYLRARERFANPKVKGIFGG